MGNCNRCEQETDARFECPACHERFCERHRAPGVHDCPAIRTDDDAGGTAEVPAGASGGASDAESTEAESTADVSATDVSTAEASVGGGAVDAATPPTRLYTGSVAVPSGPDGDDGDDPDEGGPFGGLDFDPTDGIGRPLRIAGVFAVVLLVSLVAAGVLWGGSGGVFGGAPAPGQLNDTQVERLVHEHTNRERREAGVDPLAYDEELAAISESHSRDMGANDYTSHTSPAGETTADRYRQSGYACGTIGEVLQWIDYDQVDWGGDPESSLARTVVANWMSSDRHRSFVLNGSWSRQGVGIHVTDSRQVFVTQNTCGGS